MTWADEKLRRFVIYCGEAQQHTVEAFNSADAIAKWLNLMCYDSIEQAAEENFVKVDEIHARMLW